MGMDVHGKAPSAPVGEYFRRNVWGWRPLAAMLTEMFPALTAGCTSWYSNDSDGLDSAQSIALADAVDAAIKDGRIKSYVDSRDKALAKLRDEPCKFCNGSGRRSDQVAKHMGMTTKIIDKPGHPRFGQKGWCNGCEGIGHIRPSETWYHLDEADAHEFSAFIRASGGFEIS